MMQYGLIGEKLGHSYSKEIHESLGLYKYELKEIAGDDLETFICAKEYKGLNVTIPYKEQVIPFLDYIDDGAKQIGAVNTIVNRNGKLYGYNTDYFGLLSLLKNTGFEFENKKVLILGTGGTSKTAYAVLSTLKAGSIFFVSRSTKDGCISYLDAIEHHSDADFIVNTTPSGMYPHIDAQAIDLEPFKNLYGVADVIYNPCRTKLMLQAQKLGKKAYGGLNMLVYQAIVAAQFFTDSEIDINVSERIFKSVRAKNENIVLIGMPGAGKSTIGRKLAKELSMTFIDTDAEIVKQEKCEISEIFANKGEKYFRDVEEEIVKKAAASKNAIISTGGGAILRQTTVDTLKAYGRLYFLDRKPEVLVPTNDRPLANSSDKMVKLYKERLPIYISVADVCIDGSIGIEAELETIKKDRNEH